MRWLVLTLAWVVLGVAIWAALPFGDGAELDAPALPESTAYDGNVHLTIRSIDLGTQELTVTAHLGLTGADRAQQDGATASLAVRSGPAADGAGGGTVRDVADIPLDATNVEVPSFRVPLARGSANDYPHDHYSAQLLFQLTVPDGGPGDGRRLVLYVSTISLDDSLRDWTLPVPDGPTRSFYDQDGAGPRTADDIRPGVDPVRFDLVRGPRLHAYVYSVLAMPLLLVAALLVFRRRTGGSALEVAAALLAVVTLRQVLVPGDISGFTVLDKLLGIEVAIIAVASIHAQAAARRRAERRAEQPGHAR